MLFFLSFPLLYLYRRFFPRTNTFAFIAIIGIAIQSIHIIISFLLEQLIDARQSLIEIALIACSQIVVKPKYRLLPNIFFDLYDMASTISKHFF